VAKRKSVAAKAAKAGAAAAKKSASLIGKGKELVREAERDTVAKARHALEGLRSVVESELQDNKLSGFVAAMAKRSVAAVRAGLTPPPSLKVDPRLRFLAELVVEAARSHLRLASVASESGLAESFSPHEQEVLVRGEGDDLEAALKRAGMTVWSVTRGVESVVSGVCSLTALPDIAELPQVHQVESARTMTNDLDRSRPEIRAEQLHTPHGASATKVRGKGTIVGIIDSGIDYTHADFRTAQGKSRILFLWDQVAAPAAGGSVPFGREYTQSQLNAALASANPFAKVPHKDDAVGHGTHVAGIAAGNGRANAAFTGIAPEADLIVVAYGGDKQSLGKSVRAAEAVSYLVRKADGEPIAINMSQGMNGGGHAGETLLETRMDLLAREPNVVIVKSAGNEQQQRIHAGGLLAAGQTLPLGLGVENNDQFSNVVEVWWGGGDRISVAIQPPESSPLAWVAPGEGQSFTTQAGNRVRVDVDVNADGTGDQRAVVTVAQGSAAFIQPGTWKLLLRGDAITHGRYDAWIERTNRSLAGEQMRFLPAVADNTRTISIPGTARRIITVGSYVTRAVDLGEVEGAVSPFSSRGPTRYGLQKPEIVAPGQSIISARNHNSGQPANPDAAHTQMPGTSMASPHVAGVAALVLSQQPGLTCEQVKQILMRAARRTGAAATAPDNTWGNGMLDAAAAVALAKKTKFPKISQVKVTGTLVRVKTNVPTTAAVRYHTHRRQLELGRATGSRVTLVPAKTHTLDLAGLAAGKYLCEVNVFSADNWSSTDDREGQFYAVTVE
jgi:subtilisin family serine protease